MIDGGACVACAHVREAGHMRRRQNANARVARVFSLFLRVAFFAFCSYTHHTRPRPDPTTKRISAVCCGRSRFKKSKY